jgi:phage tail-like protein
MGVLGSPRTFHKRFKFIVEIDGIASAAFQSCSELAVEVAKVEHWEGGVLIPDKTPGRVTFTDITLERGVTTDRDMWDWLKEVADAAANSGLIDPEYKRNLDIVQQDRDGTTLRRWRISNAWPMKFVGGSWDNNTDETNIESVTLTYDSFDLEQ